MGQKNPSPEGNEVIDYCDKCGRLITWDDKLVKVESSHEPDQVWCGPCADAWHEEFWNAPLDFD